MHLYGRQSHDSLRLEWALRGVSCACLQAQLLPVSGDESPGTMGQPSYSLPSEATEGRFCC